MNELTKPQSNSLTTTDFRPTTPAFLRPCHFERRLLPPCHQPSRAQPSEWALAVIELNFLGRTSRWHYTVARFGIERGEGVWELKYMMDGVLGRIFDLEERSHVTCKVTYSESAQQPRCSLPALYNCRRSGAVLMNHAHRDGETARDLTHCTKTLAACTSHVQQHAENYAGCT